MTRSDALGPRLSEAAKHLLVPTGIVSSSFPRIERAAARCGVRFDRWQQGLGALLLGKRADGRYACGVGGACLSIPRQTGKTFTVAVLVVFLCVSRSGTKALWTAHRSRTSAETFKFFKGFVSRPMLRGRVANVRQSNGQEEIEFSNGSRILVGAREYGFGRGFDDVDVEVFDEAQILTERALDDMLPATSVAPNPLVVYMGTPPRPTDPGEVFSGKRAGALEMGDTETLWVEFGADRGCDLDDRGQWERANPSFPHRTKPGTIERMRKQLSDDSFRREILGVWDVVSVSRAIPAGVWERGSVPARSGGRGVDSFAVDMPPDRGAVTIGACRRFDDGRAHIEVAARRGADEGWGWAVEWLVQRWPRAASVVIDSQSPAMALVPELVEAHVRVTVTRAADMGVACGRVIDMLKAGRLEHLDDDAQPDLAAAVAGLTTRPVGKAGAFAWNRAGGDVDISPMVACTLALHGAYTSKRDPRRKAKVV